MSAEITTTSGVAEEKRSYYIVMTSEIYDDERVNDGALRLYGHIARYASSEGYCWASNAKLAEDCKKSERAVRDALKLLEECGHIYRDADAEGRRRIWIKRPTVAENCHGGGENPPSPQAEICHQNNTSNNNTPYSPPEGEGARKAKATKERREELERFWTAFWNAYPKKVDKKEAREKFMRLAPDRPLMVTIYRALEAQKQTPKWRDKRYIPSPRRWIAKELWTDEVEVASAGSGVIEDEEVVDW